MADAITIKALQGASLDAKSLEEVVNGDAVTTVLSRLGETYPTLSNALNQIDSKLDSADTQIKQGITNLFENGGLPATPFATKALMTASALVDGKYAMVTDDAVNNGLYVKTAGAWVKSAYDISAIMEHVAIRELFNKNNHKELLDSLFYKNKVPANYKHRGYIASASTTTPLKWAATSGGLIYGYPVVAGTRYTVETINLPNDPDLLAYKVFYGVYTKTPLKHGEYAESFWERLPSTGGSATKMEFVVPEGMNFIYINVQHNSSNLYASDLVIYPTVAGNAGLEIPSYLKQTEESIGSGSEKTHKKYDYNHFLIHGQSLSVGTNSGSVISTSQPYENVTINGGVKSTQVGTNFIPLVESGTETPCSAAANTAVREADKNKGWKPSDYRVVATTSGADGRPIDQLSEGGQYWSRVGQQISQAHLIASNLNKSHAVHAVGWIQGEANNQPTSFPNQLLSRQQYYDALIALQGQLDKVAKKHTKQSETVKLITYQVSYSSLAHADVALAQLDAVQKNPNFGLSTPTYHIQHSADKVHLTALGYKHMGAYFGRAYYQFIIEGRKPDYINPRNAVNNNGVITVEFDVPKLPLVIDAVKLASTEDSGFKVVGAVSRTKLPIISITTDSNKVVISLETPTTEQVEVRYGLDYVGTGLNIKNAASGNLRDSTTETVTVSGQVLPLFHVCPHFKLLSFEDLGI